MRLPRLLKDLFLPHARNNHRAGLLHPSSLSLLVGLFLTVQFGLNFFSLVRPSVLGFASDIKAPQVIEITNQRRLEKGLPPLAENQLLDEVAGKKARDMFGANYWAHRSPSGKDPWAFFKEVGYDYLYAGENLARDFMDSESLVEAWMNSPSHRDNILHPKYKEIGLAVVNGLLNGVETTLVVQSFGTRSAAVAGLPAERKPNLGLSVAVAAEEKIAPTAKFSPFALTKVLAVFIFGLVAGVLLLDTLFVYQRRIIRLSSKNIAHLIFISGLLIVIILTTQGVIL